MDKRRKAKSLLVHYFEMASNDMYIGDYDNQAEIEAIVDNIIDAAVSEAVKQIKAELALGGVYTGQ